MLGVEQAFIHVHIDDLGPLVDLLPCHIDGLFVVTRKDKLGKGT